MTLSQAVCACIGEYFSAEFAPEIRLGKANQVRPPEVMTGATDRAAGPARKGIYIVNNHGWHVMNIMPKSQDPGSAFTIGLSRMFETVAVS
jgi:hypothetical protein